MSSLYIDPRFWDDVSGQPPEAKLFWAMLLTHPFGQLVPGLLRYGVVAFSDEHRLERDVVLRAVAQLQRAGLVIYDDHIRLFRIPRATLYCQKAGPNSIKGWWRHWRTMPESPLKYDHVESLRRACTLRENSPIVRAWEATFGTVSGEAPKSALQGTPGFELPLFNQPQRNPSETLPEHLRNPSGCDVVRSTWNVDSSTDPIPEDLPDVRAAGNGTSSAKPAKRRNGKHAVLERHRETALKLWGLQNELRRKAMPTARDLAAVDASLLMIAERLEEGYSAEDCEHALRWRALDAARNPDAAKYFNGVSNWRPENFRFALGQSLDKRPAPRPRMQVLNAPEGEP